MLYQQVKTPKFAKTSLKKYLSLAYIIGLTGIFLVSSSLTGLVQADQFDEQIREINQQNAVINQGVSNLRVQAASFEEVISQLQAEINGLQAQIDANVAEQQQLEAQIIEAQKQLDEQRRLLGVNIRAMYLEGEISTLEMLASSNDLSDFLNKQQYRSAVQDKIKATVDKITLLKRELKLKKEKVEQLLATLGLQRAEVAARQAEQQRLLAMNQAERAALNGQITNNNSRIAELRRQQAVENAKRFRGMHVVAGSNGNDTYPNYWRNAPMDSMIDSWGMYNRECVSYTAWKVAHSGRYMPYWGGIGNANQWDDNARRMGIPVDSNPRPGDVAVAHWGYYGHVMYVESVNSDGSINISQYNWDWNGTYSEVYNFPASGLVFIHFQ